ncbi:MAG: DNA-binding response regulator [Nitrosomonas sp.]|uniref:hypothetical protein n=1 Tax=Nitrosomonas sp. TaxID=42353 RepID=UPI0032EF555D
MNTDRILKNILIIDDQLGERQEFKEKLLKIDPSFHITEAANDREAINCVKTLAGSDEKIELIFMDYLLPGSSSDGIGLAKKIKTRYPEVILYFRTAYYFSGNEKMMLEVSDGIFYKQLTALEVMNWIKENLDGGSRERVIDPNGLTDRKVEIMQLLADGRTNQDIADTFWTNNQIEDFFKKNYDRLTRKTHDITGLSCNLNFWPDNLEVQYYLRLAIRSKSNPKPQGILIGEKDLAVNVKATVFRKAIRSIGYRYKQKYQSVRSEDSLTDESQSQVKEINSLFNELDQWIKRQIEEALDKKSNILKEDHLIKRFYEENYKDELIVDIRREIRTIEATSNNQNIIKNAKKFVTWVRNSARYRYPDLQTNLAEKLSDYIKSNISDLDKQLKDHNNDNESISKLRTQLDQIQVWGSSLKNVETLCSQIINDLGLAGRAELINYAAENYKLNRKLSSLPDILPVIRDDVLMEDAFKGYVEERGKDIPVTVKVIKSNDDKGCSTEEIKEKLTDLMKSTLFFIGCKNLSYIDRQGIHQTDKIDVLIQLNTSKSEIALLITSTKKLPASSVTNYPDAIKMEELMKVIGGSFQLIPTPDAVTFKAFLPLS